jgi:prevent-host-death family protein
LGRCVSTDPASDLISRGETLLGFCRAFDAIEPTFDPDFSFAIGQAPHSQSGRESVRNSGWHNQNKRKTFCRGVIDVGAALTIMTIMSSDASNQTWSVAEAKARFSEVVLRAKAGEPQRVTRYGKDEVVIVAADRFDNELGTPQPAHWLNGSLLDFFEPLRGSGLEIERMGAGGRRPLDFGHPEFDPPEEWPDRPPRIAG